MLETLRAYGAGLLADAGDQVAALGHFSELRDAAAQRGPCWALAEGLVGRGTALASSRAACDHFAAAGGNCRRCR
jgi:hypothetical protein